MFKIFLDQQFSIKMVEAMPSFIISLIIANYLYKFGSFAIECIAFIITWGLIAKIVQRVLRY